MSKINIGFRCEKVKIEAECEKQLLLKISRTASAVLAKPASAEAYSGLPGIKWPETLLGEVSTHVFRGLIRGGLATPSTTQQATRLRTGLVAEWNSVAGGVDADSAGWWSSSEKKGLLMEALGRGRGGAITQLEDWLMFNPDDLAGTKWDLMNNAWRMLNIVSWR